MMPIRDMVLTKPFPSEEKSEGGIFVSEAHRPTSNKHKVIAAGNGIKGKPMEFKKDDIVFRVKDDGTPIEISGELHFLIKQSDLRAKLV